MSGSARRVEGPSLHAVAEALRRASTEAASSPETLREAARSAEAITAILASGTPSALELQKAYVLLTRVSSGLGMLDHFHYRDFSRANVEDLLLAVTNEIFHRLRVAESLPLSSRPTAVSRRTRLATGLALRLLPAEDRTRYREEFAAELADLPRRVHARYAARQALLAWETRRALEGSHRSRTTLVAVFASSAAGTAVAVSAIGWPTAVLGCAMIVALMWTLNSQQRTRRLASLMRAARSGPAGKKPRGR